MGLNLKKKFKRAARSMIKYTVKKPLKFIKKSPKLLVNTLKNPLDFKSAAGLTLLAGPQVSAITHPKEVGIVSGLATGTYFAAASTAAGGASSAGSGTFNAGAGEAAKKSITDKVIEKGTDFALETAVVKKLQKDAAKVSPPIAPTSQPDQATEPPGTIAGVKTSTLITGGVSLLSLVAILSR